MPLGHFHLFKSFSTVTTSKDYIKLCAQGLADVGISVLKAKLDRWSTDGSLHSNTNDS